MSQPGGNPLGECEMRAAMGQCIPNCLCQADRITFKGGVTLRRDSPAEIIGFHPPIKER
jgi:hypothetical protein